MWSATCPVDASTMCVHQTEYTSVAKDMYLSFPVRWNSAIAVMTGPKFDAVAFCVCSAAFRLHEHMQLTSTDNQHTMIHIF